MELGIKSKYLPMAGLGLKDVLRICNGVLCDMCVHDTETFCNVSITVEKQYQDLITYMLNNENKT